MNELPEWARELIPINMDGAAALLGISRRFLIEVLKDHPHFERRGAKKVFYREHIMQLRKAMSEPKLSKPINDAAFSPPLPITEDEAFEEALRLAKQNSGRRRLGRL